MSEASGSWKTGSGLLDDYDFHIEEAWFGTNEKFGDSVLLNLRGPAFQDGEEVEDEHTILLSCGDGWTPGKGGTVATHSAGKSNFTKNSNIGRFIDSLVALGDDVIDELQGRGETYQADTWMGLQLHIERQEFSYTDRKTKETRTYEVPLPTDFLGVGEAEKKAPAKKAAAKKAPAKRRARTKKSGDDLRDAVMTFAAQWEEHSDFLEAVYDESEFSRAGELEDNEDLAAEILDDEGDLWTKSRDIEPN